jgi:general nucleoside transport system permease protein
VLPAAVLFGALESGANAMQRDAGVPAVVAGVVEAVVVLAVLAANRAIERRVVAPPDDDGDVRVAAAPAS